MDKVEKIDKSLDEAAEEYRRETCNEACKNGFLDNHSSPSIKTAFIAGANWQKEQMLKDAVEADVNIYRNFPSGKSWAEFIVEMPTNNLGDKVRVIIVKEDEK